MLAEKCATIMLRWTKEFMLFTSPMEGLYLQDLLELRYYPKADTVLFVMQTTIFHEMRFRKCMTAL